MKKHFITGLVILLPLALTITILVFIFNLLTVPFLGIVKFFFTHYHLFTEGFLFLSSTQIQNLVARFLILTSLFFLAVGLGFIGRWFFFKTMITFAEYLVERIPLVRSIYKMCQDVIKTIFASKTKSFKQVVLTRFPNTETYAIGLVTREECLSLKNTTYGDSTAVFIPTTPNPTSGFLVFHKQSELIYLDMKVEDAFKYIISCGLIAPVFRAISKEEAAMHQLEQEEEQS
jgi:uncharacterized membrane protein